MNSFQFYGICSMEIQQRALKSIKSFTNIKKISKSKVRTLLPSLIYSNEYPQSVWYRTLVQSNIHVFFSRLLIQKSELLCLIFKLSFLYPAYNCTCQFSSVFLFQKCDLRYLFSTSTIKIILTVCIYRIYLTFI